MPLSRHSVGTYQVLVLVGAFQNLSGNELTRNSSGNTWSQSSQLAEPLKTDLAIKNRISVRELISTLKKKKKAQTGMNGRTFSQNPCKRGKSHHVKQGLMQTLF